MAGDAPFPAPPPLPAFRPPHHVTFLTHRRSLLNDEGVVEAIDAADTDDPNAHPLIRDAVDGTILAVDISEWIFQATSQPATAELFTPRGQVAKLVFDRAVNWLRLGCVPVGVIDGRPPPEKLARLKQRYGALYSNAGGRGGGGQFKSLGDVALRVLRLLGLPAVEAPGEVRRGGEAFFAHTLTIPACTLRLYQGATALEAFPFRANGKMFFTLFLLLAVPRRGFQPLICWLIVWLID